MRPEPDSLQEGSIGDTGRGEEDVVAGDEVRCSQDSLQVVTALQRGLPSVSLRDEPAQHLPPRQRSAHAASTPSGVPPVPTNRSHRFLVRRP